jgi:hypothetical protein
MKGHKKIMKFNGKRYRLKDTAYNKEDAIVMAESARRRGWSARINKRTGKGFGYGREPMYGIYIR